MASNRAQRRAAKHKGKRQGETYMDVLTQKQMIKKAVEDSVHDHSVALESDIKTQRLLWMCIVSLNRAFGYAGIRSQRFLLTIDEVREEMEDMAKENGWEYTIEKLREAAAKITRMEVKQVHEEEMMRARKENEANGIFFPAEDPDKFNETDFAPFFEKEKWPKWIPVTERMPEPIPCNAGTAYSEAVIVCTSGKKLMVAVWDGIDFLCDMEYWEAWGETITHWMPTEWMLPLPEGPK